MTGRAGATYTVRWQRSTETEVMECRGLDLRTMAGRLMDAIRHSGPITVHEVRREPKESR